jgi:hypothetical protein
MNDAERFRQLGKYRTPGFRIGRTALCQVRGEMVITGMTDAPIPWPIGKHGAGRHSLIVYKGLAKAVRRESELAVCYWWGVKPSTVRKWRRALGVGIVTEGTSRLFRDYTKEPWLSRRSPRHTARPAILNDAARLPKPVSASPARRTSWRRCTKLAGDRITRRKPDSG